MYLPDPIEMQWAYENVKGDIATCACGKEFKLEDGKTLTSDPYAIPVCFEKYMFRKP